MRVKTIRIEKREGIYSACVDLQNIIIDLVDQEREGMEVFPVELEVFVYRNMIAGGLKK